MRKVLVAVAVASLALAALGPPAMARDEGVQLEKAYQVDSANAVSQDLAFTARAVYHPSAGEVLDAMQVSEKSGEKPERRDRPKEGMVATPTFGSSPKYPLRP